MNYIIDVIFLLCLCWGAYKGFGKGFIIQSFTVFALALAIWGGFAFAGKVEPLLKDNFKQIGDMAAAITSFVIVFLFILIFVYISGTLATKFLNAITLGLMNRLAGAAFGIFINALILSVLILLFNRINEKKHFIKLETLEKSYLYYPIEKIAPAILPEWFFKISTV